MHENLELLFLKGTTILVAILNQKGVKFTFAKEKAKLLRKLYFLFLKQIFAYGEHKSAKIKISWKIIQPFKIYI